MAMAGRWAMTTDRLTLTQLLSPAFPIGSYAYSQGLESAMVAGAVHDAASLSDWVRAVLSHGSGRMDAILIAHARTPDADLTALSDLTYAYATSAERQTELRDQGAAFGQLVTALTGQHQPALPYPLALGLSTRPLNLPTDEILALYLHALAAQLISAAVRFIPLAATTGQQTLATLAPLMTQIAAEAATAPLTSLASSTLGADMAAMRHETLDVRIFRS